VRTIRPLYRALKVARFLRANLDGIKDDWQPSWNIPPTERIAGARERVDDNGGTSRSLELYRWDSFPSGPRTPQWETGRSRPGPLVGLPGFEPGTP
jgi:hypothetical protein